MNQFYSAVLAIMFVVGSNVPDERALGVVKSTSLSVPAFGIAGNPEADEDNNLFFKIDDLQDTSGTGGYSVLKLTPGNISSPVLFEKGSELASFDCVEFGVSRSGTVNMLCGQMPTNKTFIFHFSSDGRVISKTPLDLPASFRPTGIAVLKDGSALIHGFLHDPELRDNGVLIRVDSKGATIKNYRKVIPAVDLAQITAQVKGGSFRVSDRETLISVSPNQINEFDLAGQKVFSMPFTNPVRDSRIVNLLSEGNVICLVIVQLGDDGRTFNKIHILMVDRNSKSIYAHYTYEAKWIGPIVSYSREEGFLLFHFLEGRPTITYLKP